MRLISRPLDLLREDPSAAALLGSDHPLVRAADRFSLRVQQSLIVAALLSGSSIALVEGLSAALSFVVAAAVVLAAFVCGAVVAAWAKRERALDLIIEGRGYFPLDVINRERRRLLDPNHRDALARSLDGMRVEAENPVHRRPLAPPVFSARAIAAVASDLTDIARLLCDDHASPRGVAMARRLLFDGTSPLDGEDVGLLREELHRIRFLLES
jgi:hypothetical protein